MISYSEEVEFFIVQTNKKTAIQCDGSFFSKRVDFLSITISFER